MNKLFKISLCSLGLTLSCIFSFSQEIVELGFKANSEVRCLFFDSLSQKLYVGGKFDSLLTDSGKKLIEVNKIAAWDGTKWDSVDNTHNHKTYVIGIKRVKDKLTFIGTGGAHILDSDTLKRLPLGGTILNVEEIKDTVYFVGLENFNKADTHKVEGIAKWDGQNFYAMPKLEKFGSFYNYSAISGYKDEIYVGGNFTDFQIPERADLMKFDGQNWLPVGGGIDGGPWIYDMTVFKNELYIAGYFNKQGNWPEYAGRNIIKWDGENWYSVGGLGLPGQQVTDLNVNDSLLIAVGLFEIVANEINTKHIAVLNGNKWCTYDFNLKNIGSVSSNDTMLFVGGWDVYNGQTLIGIKNFRNFSNCSTPVAVEKIEPKDLFGKNLKAFPNPFEKSTTIQWQENKEAKSLVILNQNGIEIKRINYPNNNLQMDLTDLPSGNYLVKLTLLDNSIMLTQIIKK